MYSKNFIYDDRFWLFSSLVSFAVLYLNLIWQTTGDIDQLTTNCLFWGAILWLLWQKRNQISYFSDTFSSFFGFLLLSLILAKIITLFWFESTLLALVPLGIAIALALIASGFQGLGQYFQELFLAWFLFFPSGIIGHFIDNLIQITILNAKFATYFLYYLGFEVANQGNQVLLILPELGEFKAIVDYPCAGLPMIILMLKLALILIGFTSLSKKQQLLIAIFSITLGFFLGVIRVCILTLLIPNPAKFEYWHGNQGSQVFSTLAIFIFAGFCYWILQQDYVQAKRLT